MCSFMKLYMIIAELLMILITLAHTTAQSQLQMFILGFDSSLTWVKVQNKPSLS